MKIVRNIILALVMTCIVAPTAVAGEATNEKTTAEVQTDEAYRRFAFAWGSDLSGNVDLSAHDMSAIGLCVEAGMRWRWIRFLGVGVEGNIMVGNSNRSYPLFVNFRTDFSNRRRLVFMDLRGGVAFNYFNDNDQETGAYASGGFGVTLAAGKTFSSHIILAYTYLSQDKCFNGNYERDCPGISMVTLRLGVAF